MMHTHTGLGTEPMPVARLENLIIYGTLGIILVEVLPRVGNALVLTNLKSKTQKDQTIYK